MIIIGAGLSGLIAAHAFPRAEILEAAPEPSASHAALLRFRSDVVANLVGIPFKRVDVNKGIWHKGRFRTPTIQLANLYSQKVIGRIADRSIWNLKVASRFIAPEDFYEQLVAAVGARIRWGATIGSFDALAGQKIISTMPLPAACAAAGIETDLEFRRSPITVSRFRIEGCDVYQTIYFPDPAMSTYRASITGSLLTVESINVAENSELDEIIQSFGNIRVVNSLGRVAQRFGKIAPVDDAQRKALLFKLTHANNVYSVGRFAIWKNILLDDVVHDLMVVRQMMNASIYDQHRVTHRTGE